MATVTMNDIQCGVIYNITAEGAFNRTLVGPGSPHGSVAAGPCPVIASECMYMKYVQKQHHAYVRTPIINSI